MSFCRSKYLIRLSVIKTRWYMPLSLKFKYIRSSNDSHYADHSIQKNTEEESVQKSMKNSMCIRLKTKETFFFKDCIHPRVTFRKITQT